MSDVADQERRRAAFLAYHGDQPWVRAKLAGNPVITAEAEAFMQKVLDDRKREAEHNEQLRKADAETEHAETQPAVAGEPAPAGRVDGPEQQPVAVTPAPAGDGA
jgi:hypothetical protein